MGNASSSSGRSHHEESVDYGALVPQGVYTGPRDWNHAVVSQLIISRKLAPFYRPLEDYNESWDDDQILAARKEFPGHPENDHSARSESIPHSLSSKSSYSKRSVSNKEPIRPEATLYRGAVECPICFLYYPSNINHSRCCDQAICTECFVQIKRNEPTTTHIVSEPAACPYCVQENFGVVYSPPPWRAGIGSDGSSVQLLELSRESTPQPPGHKRRQKSYSADSPEVVATDQIRPDWEAKLAAVRAAVTRRANRRIIMRQVGDRLIPVGVTSGRVHALNPEEVGADTAEGGGSRRRRRHGGNSQLEQFMSMPGQDLEELMLMEAMRLSLLEHEEQQRKQAEERRKQEAAAAANTNESARDSEPSASQPISSSGAPTLEASITTPPSNPSIPSSSLAPISTSPTVWQHREPSDTGQQKSRSASRGRTPPPPSNNGMSNGESPPWNHRAANPPPFSALTAALASASTAAAILGPPPRQESRAHSHNTSVHNTVPTITVDNNDPNDLNHDRNIPSPTAPSNDNPDQRLPPKDGSSSSLNLPDSPGNTSSGYGQLPSSPDSGLLNEPLLNPSRKVNAEPDHTSTSRVLPRDDRPLSAASR